MKITIDESLHNAKSGVYLISFDNGYFYIGCSKDLKGRIKSHIKSIGLDFKSSSASLRKMKGFDGCVTFSLLEEVVAPYYGRFSFTQILFVAESKHIMSNIRNKMCLNRFY